MRRFLLVLVLVLLLPTVVRAEDDPTWASRPAVRVGKKVFTRADIGRRLLTTFGLSLLRGQIFHAQLRQALAAKEVTVDPDAVEAKQRSLLADLEMRGIALDEALAKSHTTMAGFELDVWNQVAGEVLARKVGVSPPEIGRYLALNFPTRPSDGPDDPVFVSVGEQQILLRTLLETLLPLVSAEERNHFLDLVLTGEAVEQAIAGKITEPTDAEVAALEGELRKQVLERSGGRQSLEMVLRGQRQTIESFRRTLRLAERVRRAILAETSEEAIREHFERWIVFFRGKRVRVSHILIRVPEGESGSAQTEALETIRDLRKQIMEGADFGDVAIKHSQDSRSQIRGGDLGFIPRKSPLLAESFVAAAFDLEKGEVSEPVRTTVGYHLIKATDIRPGKDVTLDDVRDAVRRDYAESRSSAWTAAAKKGLTIEVLWEELKVPAAPAGGDR